MTVTEAELGLRRLRHLYGYEYEIAVVREKFWEAVHRPSGDIIRADSAAVLVQQVAEHRRGLRC